MSGFSSFRFSGSEIASMMRRNGKTIRALSAAMGISMKRIREIRKSGISGLAAMDWYEAINGELSGRMRAALASRANS